MSTNHRCQTCYQYRPDSDTCARGYIPLGATPCEGWEQRGVRKSQPIGDRRTDLSELEALITASAKAAQDNAEQASVLQGRVNELEAENARLREAVRPESPAEMTWPDGTPVAHEYICPDGSVLQIDPSEFEQLSEREVELLDLMVRLGEKHLALKQRVQELEAQVADLQPQWHAWAPDGPGLWRCLWPDGDIGLVRVPEEGDWVWLETSIASAGTRPIAWCRMLRRHLIRPPEVTPDAPGHP